LENARSRARDTKAICMDTLPKAVIIIPCYNEENRLDVQSFSDYVKSNSNIFFLFVNDGSSDNTGKIIKELALKNSNKLFCKNLEKNCGKAEAIRQGFLEAFKMDADYIGFLDADLATPLSSIDEFCQFLKTEGISIVIGSRVRLLGRKIERR
jgi:dolichyl-phosphate beta-glucosyltransferase